MSIALSNNGQVSYSPPGTLNGGSPTLTLTAGHLFLVGIQIYTSSVSLPTGVSISDNKGDTFTTPVFAPIPSGSASSGGYYLHVGYCYAMNVVGGSTTIAVTWTGFEIFLNMYDFSGLATTAASDGTTMNMGTTVYTTLPFSITAGTILPTQSSDLIYTIICADNTLGSESVGTGYTQGIFGTEEYIVTPLGSISPYFTATGNANPVTVNWAAMAIAFAQAPVTASPQQFTPRWVSV